MDNKSFTHKYIPRTDLYENNLFLEEYYASPDVKIFMDNQEQTQISYISYSLQEQLKPIYGYASNTFDDMAVGNRIATGMFKTPIKNTEKQTLYNELIKEVGKEAEVLNFNEEEQKIIQETDWIKTNNEATKLINDSKLKLTTVKNLTKRKYKELKYQSGDKVIKGKFVNDIKQLLKKVGYTNVSENDTYDYQTSRVIMQFQKSVGMKVTGVLNSNTLNALRKLADQMNSDVIKEDEDGILGKENKEDYTKSPHFNSFFDKDNEKTFRKNHYDIKIIIGEKHIVKTIKSVFMRSVSVEVDTSGNPVSEVYEFIGQDLTETDNDGDILRYLGTDDMTPSEIKYIYNFK